jgi:hypothetical protein
MGLLDQTPPTPQELAAQTKDAIRKKAILSLGNIKRDLEYSFNLFWFPTAPQTVQMNADAFGTECAELFQLNSHTIDFIQLLDQTYVPPTPGAYTINQDGTVTIG